MKETVDGPPQDRRQRIDKWLWHARIVRTRSAAQTIAVSGRVRINKVKNGSAAHPVRPGDVLTISGNNRVRVLRVRAIAARRGSPGEAAALYEELAPEARPATR